MQIGNSGSVNQVNPYAQSQVRDANAQAAAQNARPQTVEPQTPTAVTTPGKGLKANEDRKDQQDAKDLAQQAQDIARRTDAPGTKRGTLVDIVA